MELGGVFVVDPHGTLAVGDGEFRFAAEGNGPDDRAVRGVDSGGVLAATVEAEDALGGGIVNDGVGIGVGFRVTDDFQCFQIEDGHGVGATVAGEAAAEVGSDGDTVDPRSVGNVTF